MENLIQKLIPGIIALLSGLIFIFARLRIEQKIISSHEKFWKQKFKFQSEVGKFGGILLKFLILFLGISFLLIGFTLIYQFLKKGI